jgi:uncharacterized protein YcfJ
MNRSIGTGIAIGIVIAGAAGAVANLSMKHRDEAPAPLATSGTAAQPEAAMIASAPGGQPAEPEAPATAPASSTNSTPATPATPAGTVAHAAPRTTAALAASSSAPVPTSTTPFARVVRSEPIIEKERVAREECHDEQVTRQKPVKDEKRVAGAAVGAVLGGVLGHQIGSGDGRKLATVAGAVAGGYAGSKVQQRAQENNTETVTEKVCKTVYDTRDKQNGFNVTYSLAGNVHTAKMDYDPGVGASLPVRDGRPVLNAQSVAKQH